MAQAQRDFYESHVMGSHATAAPVIHLAQSRLLAKLEVAENALILDIGSGAGVGARVIGESVKSSNIVSVDVSTDALIQIGRLGGLPVMADAEGKWLPFKEDSFDIVVLDEVIEHLVDTDSIMSEIHRILKRDGLLLISTPNLGAWFNRLALMFGIQPAFSEVSRVGVFGRPGVGLVGHLRLFTRRALVQFLRAHGFRPIHLVGVVFPELPRPLRLVDAIMSRRSSLAGGLVCIARPTEISN